MARQIEQRLEVALRQREAAQNLRQLHLPTGLADFCSNDYLGLARNPALRQQIETAYARLPHLPGGSTGSRLLAGNSAFAEELEQEMAAVHGAEATLLFTSGYAANLALLSAVPQRNDTILYDELSHASIKDGARLSLAQRFSFRHNDPDDLRQKLHRAKGQRFVVAEAVYSMDGDQCPLAALADLCAEFDAALIIDEAHSTGIYGPAGAGLCVEHNLQHRVFARVFTFGKAMGAHGACIAGSQRLRDYLINFARPFIYTTALPLHTLVSIREAYRFLRQEPRLPEQLWQQVRYFNSLFRSRRGFSDSAIQPLAVPGNEQVRKAADRCRAAGLDVRAITAPTVKPGTERLRVCLHSFNTLEECDALYDVLWSL